MSGELGPYSVTRSNGQGNSHIYVLHNEVKITKCKGYSHKSSYVFCIAIDSTMHKPSRPLICFVSHDKCNIAKGK